MNFLVSLPTSQGAEYLSKNLSPLTRISLLDGGWIQSVEKNYHEYKDAKFYFVIGSKDLDNVKKYLDSVISGNTFAFHKDEDVVSYYLSLNMGELRIQPKVYYGEVACQGTTRKNSNCNNKAYCLAAGKYLCKVHSKNLVGEELPKNPDASKLKEQKIAKSFDSAARMQMENKASGKEGKVICSKYYMINGAEDVPGFRKIYPSIRSGNKGGENDSKKDVLGFPSLDPAGIGPIEHNQFGAPPAGNLENLYQGGKAYNQELDQTKRPTSLYYQNRYAMYVDKTSHKHKISVVLNSEGKNTSYSKSTPAFYIWDKKDEKGGYTYDQLSIVESRQILCHYYTKFTKVNPDFLKLKSMLAEGWNLQICGFNGFPITKSLEEHYLDKDVVIGHEFILYVMLTTEEKDWPWIKHTSVKFD